jgi:hypothetical protein
MGIDVVINLLARGGGAGRPTADGRGWANVPGRCERGWRFRLPCAAGGSYPWHYTLGYAGARVIAAQKAVRPRKALIEELIEEIQIVGPGRIRPIYGIPRPSRSAGQAPRTSAQFAQWATGVGDTGIEPVTSSV